MRSLSALVYVLLVGCEACHHAERGAPPDTPRTAAATCTVPGVSNAHRVDALTLPSGCRFTGHGSLEAPRVVRTAEELAAVVQCDAGVSPGVDLAAHDLYVAEYTLSPAGVGTETLDDGTTITFVSRFRHNCPDDPMPMPMNVTFGFLIPKGAERAVRTVSCTLPEDC